MFKFKAVKDIVMKGGVVEYRGTTLCDLTKVLKYPFKTNTPYQLNLRRSRYNKQTGLLEGDVLYNDLNRAVAEFIKECKV